jgi:F-type H+-transporting ATPase subunit delta
VSTEVISQRYARALMNLAGKDKDVDGVAAALDEVVTAIAGAQLAPLLASDSVDNDAKSEVLKTVLAKMGGPKVLSPFVRLLQQKRRLSLLPEIAIVFHRLADERLGRATADVTVADPMTSALQERLRKQIEKATGKSITLKVKVDPNILGGVVARVGSVVWNGSVRHHLDQVREQLLRG